MNQKDTHKAECPYCGETLLVTIYTKLDTIRKKATVEFDLE